MKKMVLGMCGACAKYVGGGSNPTRNIMLVFSIRAVADIMGLRVCDF